MKRVSQLSLLVLVLAVIIIGILPIHWNVRIIANNSDSTRGYASGLSELNPINITGNEGFDPSIWSGSGSASDPFTISSVNISYAGTCLAIADTTAHFIVRDSFISARQWNVLDPLIVLKNCSNGRISSSELYYASSQVSMFMCENIAIERCSFRRSATGCLGQYLKGISLISNVFIDAIWNHVTLFDIEDSLIASNAFGHSGSGGISVHKSSNLVVRNNQLSSLHDLAGGPAVEISKSDACIISNNTVRGTYLYGFHCTGNDGHMTNNRVEGANTGVRLTGSGWNVTENEFREGFHGTELLNCKSVSVSQNSYHDIEGAACVVRGGIYNIVTECEFFESVTGVLLQTTTMASVTKNMFVSCPYAITLSDLGLGFLFPNGPPRNCKLANNTLIRSGIHFSEMEEAGFRHEVFGNMVNGQPFGFFYNLSGQTIDLLQYGQVVIAYSEDSIFSYGEVLDTSDAVTIHFSKNCSIGDMLIRRCSRGVRVLNSEDIHISNIRITEMDSSSGGVSSFVLDMRNCRRCVVSQCKLSEGAVAVYQSRCSNSTIEKSQLSHNQYGVFLFDSHLNLVVHNTITDNSDVGVFIDTRSTGNRIYANKIGWNGANAVSGSQGNFWDDGVSMGNEWSDYSGNGTYYISEQEQDKYPFLLTATTAIPTVPSGAPDNIESEFISLILAASVVAAAILLQEMKRHE